MLKRHHHFLGKADIVTLIRNIFPVEPGGHGKFAVVYSQSIIAVQVAVEAEQKGSGEGPWLALVVAEIFDLYADLFHNFTVNGLLDGLTMGLPQQPQKRRLLYHWKSWYPVIPAKARYCGSAVRRTLVISN